jgi:uncharacterized membrane protein
MDGDAAEGATKIARVARCNKSLSWGGRLLVLGSLAAVVLPISLGFALSGVWLVFPFTGRELLVVGRVFRLAAEQRAAVARRRQEHLRIR